MREEIYSKSREERGRGRGHEGGEGPMGWGKTFPLLPHLNYIDMFSLPTCSAPSWLSQAQHRGFLLSSENSHLQVYMA